MKVQVTLLFFLTNVLFLIKKPIQDNKMHLVIIYLHCILWSVTVSKSQKRILILFFFFIFFSFLIILHYIVPFFLLFILLYLTESSSYVIIFCLYSFTTLLFIPTLFGNWLFYILMKMANSFLKFFFLPYSICFWSTVLPLSHQQIFPWLLIV